MVHRMCLSIRVQRGLPSVGRQEYSLVGDIGSEVVTQWATDGETCTLRKQVRLQLHSITSTTALVLSRTCWEEGG